MISGGFSFDFSASDPSAIDSATASIGSFSVNPANRSGGRPASNVFADHQPHHAASALQGNIQPARGKSVQIVTKRKRKFNCILDDGMYESEDDDIVITTGFEDGVLSSVLSKQTEFDQDTFLEEVLKERLANEMNRWEQIKQQTIDEVRLKAQTSNGLALVGDRQERAGNMESRLAFK